MSGGVIRFVGEKGHRPDGLIRSPGGVRRTIAAPDDEWVGRC